MLRILVLAAALLAGPVQAATAGYVVSLGGSYVATVTLDLKEDAGRYDIDLKASIAGLGALVSNGSATVTSSGRLNSRSLASEDFAFMTRANGGSFRIDIGFAGGNVERFIVTPPVINNIDRVAIERRQLTGVNDMVAAFILRGRRLDGSLCNRSMRIFTGLERFDIKMRYLSSETATSKRTGYIGPVILCAIRYTPVSGHFTTSELTNYLAGSDRIHIWYAPLGTTGYIIPYRVLIGTSYGDFSMVLTSMGS